MMPKPCIASWQKRAPWQLLSQIEQDLLISRTLIAIFSDDYLSENLGLRGGTALHKIYIKRSPRYSEDIDLVQIKSGPIKPIIQQINEVIDFFEEKRITKIRGHGPKIHYRFNSEHDNIRMRLKLEINCKEHFHVMDWVERPFKVNNEWFMGEALIRTYNLHELLGTKLRALYQRNKGRDLFDLDYSRLQMNLDSEWIIKCFQEYMTFSTGKIPTQKEFLRNIEGKENDASFIGDMEAILRPGIEYDQKTAFRWLKEELIEML